MTARFYTLADKGLENILREAYLAEKAGVALSILEHTIKTGCLKEQPVKQQKFDV